MPVLIAQKRKAKLSANVVDLKVGQNTSFSPPSLNMCFEYIGGD